MNEFRRMTPEEEQQYRKKKVILVSMGICAVLAILILLLLMTLQAKEANSFKLFLNEKPVPEVSDDFIITIDNESYVAAKELGELLGYRYQDGDYGSFGKDEESAYIQNDYEVASFSINSNQLKKYIKVASSLDPNVTGITVLSENGYCETTTLELPIIQNNGIIYFPLKCINDICNSISSFNNNSLYIYDLNYLIDFAKVKAVEYKCDTISGDYENLRALAYGMMVVIDNDSYGVHDLYKDRYIFGTKYDQVIFNQNVKEFLVKDARTVGILNSEGETVVDINQNYENISVLSDKLGLYLVSEDEKMGVLNREGKEIVFAEYDSIGIEQDILDEFNIKTDDLIYIPYDTMIIVNDSGKYGVYDVEEGEKLSANFTAIGCVPKNLDRDYKEEENSEIVVNPDAEKVLLIDLELEDGTGIKGIVLKSYISTLGEERYGIYDSITGRLIIPCACTQIYSTTKNGRTRYYMEFNGEQLELVQYLEEHPELNLEKYDQTSETETDEEE